MIKAVIFDMDGVIIDSEPIHFKSDQLTLKHFGKDVSQDELIRYVGVSNAMMWTELKEKYQLAPSVEELMEKQSYFRDALTADEKLEPIPGIIELLDEIKRARVKIGLASSSVRSFIALVLNNLEINHYFDAVVSGEDVKRSKPQPDIFLKAAEKLQVSPDACLVIEDSQHGVKAAIQAGMTCIGFNNPNSGSQDLSLAHTLVSSITEIPNYFRSLSC
ncbi:MAG: HAD family phosphatase [Clostridiaceae bacterium]|jgi:beta-phosphoglucomutase family hydrolase|nr:HAD family phosphatase [Clostridiaceae bacterium]